MNASLEILQLKVSNCLLARFVPVQGKVLPILFLFASVCRGQGWASRSTYTSVPPRGSFRSCHSKVALVHNSSLSGPPSSTSIYLTVCFESVKK